MYQSAFVAHPEAFIQQVAPSIPITFAMGRDGATLLILISKLISWLIASQNQPTEQYRQQKVTDLPTTDIYPFLETIKCFPHGHLN